MAQGNLSPRQKMINLMYLVFIAMLAMNMSKEVLSAFGFMNEKLSDNNTSTTEKNNAAYANLATKALYEQWSYPIMLHDIVTLLGGEITPYVSNADYDFSLSKLDKNTFIDVFRAHDRQERDSQTKKAS